MRSEKFEIVAPSLMMKRPLPKGFNMKSGQRIVTIIGLVLCLFNANAVLATSIGPGNIATTNQDGSFDMIVVDLTTSATLAAGSYVATQFNYEFASTAAGTITPLL